MWRNKFAIIFIAVLVCFLPQSLVRPAQMSEKLVITELTFSYVNDEYSAHAKIKDKKQTIEKSATGDSSLNAYYNLSTDKAVTVAHCDKVIIGEGMENENIASVLQYFLYRTEMKNHAKIYWDSTGSRETTLEEFFKDYLRPSATSVLASGDNIALFTNGKFAFELNDTQSDMVDLINKKIKKRIVHENNVLHVSNNSCKITTKLKNKVPVAEIKIKINTQYESHPFASKETIAQLQKVLETKYKDDIYNMLETAYPNADVLGLYNGYKKYNKREISFDDFMKNIQFVVKLDISINT